MTSVADTYLDQMVQAIVYDVHYCAVHFCDKASEPDEKPLNQDMSLQRVEALLEEFRQELATEGA